jgi:DnaD/phage-associated family protein
MAWIESHQSLGTHRKTMVLTRLLKIDDVRAVGHLHFLWWWALDNAPDGMLQGLDIQDIATAAHWTKNAENFVESMILSGFFEENPLRLHDWDDYAGKLINQRKANTERVRKYRNALRNANVIVTSPLRNGATVPNSTVPNSTVPNSTVPVVTRTAAFSVYENNIGQITQIIAEKIKDAENVYPEGWVTDAIVESVNHNKKNWAYIEAILKRWKEEGRGNGHKQSGNGNNGTNPQTTDADRYASIERLQSQSHRAKLPIV